MQLVMAGNDTEGLRYGTIETPEKYYLTHQELGTWQSTKWRERIQHVLTDRETRLAYD